MLKSVLVISITIAIFYIIFSKIDFWSVVEVLSHVDLFYLFIALLLMITYLSITAKRWQTILETMDYKLQYKECFYVMMGAQPIASITPSKSGDIAKAYYLRDSIPVSKTIGSILTERMFDFFTLLLFFLIGTLFSKRYELVGIALVILTCIIAIFLPIYAGFSFHLPMKQSWNEKIQNLTLSMKLVTKDKKVVSTVMFYSFTFWFLSVVQILTFFYALGINLPLAFAMANIPIVIFIGYIPITLGGMGTRDAAIVFLFSDYAEPSILLGVGILFSVFRYLLPSLLGIPFMREARIHK
jgi:uncharacterized protein (TIRG00374 family)